MLEDKVLTTQELSEYLKLNEKTIIKMAQTGKLPGVKVGNQWRFHLDTIDSYLQNTFVKMPDEELNAIINTSTDIIPLSRLTNHNLIDFDIEASNGSVVLVKLAEIACNNGLSSSVDVLLDELKKREEMLSTAMGSGVALPHPRHPSIDLFKDKKVIIVRSQQGVDFNAPDDKLVHIFFMPCAPNEAVHIRLLAKIAKLLHAPNVIDRLMSVKAGDDIIKILLEFERDSMLVGSKVQ